MHPAQVQNIETKTRPRPGSEKAAARDEANVETRGGGRRKFEAGSDANRRYDGLLASSVSFPCKVLLVWEAGEAMDKADRGNSVVGWRFLT